MPALYPIPGLSAHPDHARTNTISPQKPGSALLTEWCRKHPGVYWVADESAAAIQRRYLAEAMDAVFTGFAAVQYPDWSVLLDRVSAAARAVNWHGRLVLDEFPYLVAAAPELPSVLQRWVDREKREDGILLAVSGSSQRMMMDHILNADAPLYGRADEILKLEPLRAGYIAKALPRLIPEHALDFYTCWGGVPRYWELAEAFGADYEDAVDELVLSPLGVLHDEVDRLLRQEMPSAVPLRPILDAIGLGAHRSFEIAGRLQTAATSIARPLRQLQELGYIRREVPYGASEKRSKKAIYGIADPFLRLWFRTIAPHRGALQSATRAERRRFLEKVWPRLRAEAWEALCRQAVPRLRVAGRDWKAGGRYWDGREWDVVSTPLEGNAILIGECKSLSRRARPSELDGIFRELAAIFSQQPRRSDLHPAPTNRSVLEEKIRAND